MDLLTGGDLRYQLVQNKSFNEQQTSNYIKINNNKFFNYRIFPCLPCIRFRIYSYK